MRRGVVQSGESLIQFIQTFYLIRIQFFKELPRVQSLLKLAENEE